MIFYNYLDEELVIINNVMSEFCNGLWNIDFQNLFSRDRDFLNNILCKVNMSVHHRMYCKYLSVNNMNVPIQASYFNVYEIKIVIKNLQTSSQYMHDISNNGKADIVSYQFKLMQQKIDELLLQMSFDNVPDNEAALMNFFLNDFFQDLRFILSKTQDQEFLENILCDVQNILENKIINTCGTDNLMGRLSLNQDQVIVLIKALKLLPRYFDDWDVETRIGGSFLEIDILLAKLECWQLSMKFNIVSDNNLNHLYTMINDLIDEIDTSDCQSSLPCNKQFLEDILSKIMVIIDNRVFFEKWSDYNPLVASSLDADEIKVVIKMLDKKYDQQTQELKNKLESLLS